MEEEAAGSWKAWLGLRLEGGLLCPPNTRQRGLEELRLVPDPGCSLSYIGSIYLFNHSIHHLFRKFLLSPFFVPRTILGTGDTAVNEEIKPCLILAGETDSKQDKVRWVTR